MIVSRLFFLLIAASASFSAEAFDRRLVEKLSEVGDNVDSLKAYVSELNADENNAISTLSPVNVDFLDQKFAESSERISSYISAQEVRLENWSEEKCVELRQRLKKAQDLFKEFKAIASELERLLALQDYTPEMVEKIESLYSEFVSLQKQILDTWPTLYDNWKLTNVIEWHLGFKLQPKTKEGESYDIIAFATPHLYWTSKEEKKQFPPTVSFKSDNVGRLSASVISTPAQYCASPFFMQVYLTSKDRKKQLLKLHLTTTQH